MTDVAKPVAPRAFLSDDILQILYRLLAALLICAVLAVSTDSFLYLTNILNVLRQASLLFFIASGLTLVVLTGGLDLSVGANVALSACVAGTVIHQTGQPALGVLAGVATGASVGLLNGVMVTALRIPSFIATYGMLWVLNGLTYWYMAGEVIHGFPPAFRQIGSGYLFGLPDAGLPPRDSFLRSERSSPSEPSGDRRSMRLAPIRLRRVCQAFRCRGAFSWSTRFPAPWPALPPSSLSRG